MTVQAVPLIERMRRTPVAARTAVRAKLRLVFDLSDLVQYIGAHGTLSGIQRVQSGIVQALLDGALPGNTTLTFVAWCSGDGGWRTIAAPVVTQLLQDRVVPPDGLPGMEPFDATTELAGAPSVFCPLGVAWLEPDSVRRVVALKRRHGLRFVMMVHDLAPIYAPDTFDPAMAAAFEAKLALALRHTDHVLAVSEHTARDLGRYAASSALRLPPMSVTRNGSAFWDPGAPVPAGDIPGVPGRFVLFVSTIEGRKNHLLMLDVWRRMIAAGDDPPHLVCVGRIGWRAERFLTALVETDSLDGRIVVLDTVDDAMLRVLYDRCLFTVYPSAYEGWGLPAGESLAAGKVCVTSGRTSLPEVAGAFGTTIDVDDPAGATSVIRGLITDDSARATQEEAIRNFYRPIAWNDVARSVLDGCERAAREPIAAHAGYPVVQVGREIGFGATALEPCAGPEMLARLRAVRAGYFLDRPLDGDALRTGEDMRDEGHWGEPEAWGSWLCRGAGSLVFAIPPHDDEAFVLMLRLRANGPAGELPLQLVYDGQALWTGAIGHPGRTVTATLRRPPGTDHAAPWPVRLGLQIEPSQALLATLGETDPRIPLIGFERLILIPTSDSQTCVEILTKLL